MTWSSKLFNVFRAIIGQSPNQETEQNNISDHPSESSSIGLNQLVSTLQHEHTQPIFELPKLPKPEQSDSLLIWAVDDEPVNLMVIETAMLNTGFQVRVFESATDVLFAIRNENVIPHLILADVMMPTMSGFELTEIIRISYAPNDLPIVIVSAKHRQEDIDQSKRVGANDFLKKPFARADLLTRVKSQLHSA